MATNKIAIRRDTAANWTAWGGTLAAGEWAYETDTGAAKLGDGTTEWTSLAYLRNLHNGAIYLGGTAAANLLDDYEEGTWTPVIADDFTAGNVGTATATGSYIKLGSLVYIQVSLSSIDTTGMTSGNPLYIRNLPFQSSSDNIGATASCRADNVTFGGYLYGVFGPSRTHVYLQSITSGGAFTSINVSAFTSGTAGIVLGFSYNA